MALLKLAKSAIDIDTVKRILDLKGNPRLHGESTPTGVQVVFEDGDRVDFVGEDADALRAYVASLGNVSAAPPVP